MNDDFKDQGIDQISHLLQDLKSNPTSKRLILSAWNTSDLTSMVSPPCHTLAQFHLSPDSTTLSCQLYHQSADLALGVPRYLALYSLLTCVLAQLSNLKPGQLIHTMGEAYIDKKHIETLKI